MAKTLVGDPAICPTKDVTLIEYSVSGVKFSKVAERFPEETTSSSLRKINNIRHKLSET